MYNAYPLQNAELLVLSCTYNYMYLSYFFTCPLCSLAGVVTGMLGVPASQVAMGRSHTCVLTQHGTVYTFGTNSYGQCGRNFVPTIESETSKLGLLMLTVNDSSACTCFSC